MNCPHSSDTETDDVGKCFSVEVSTQTENRNGALEKSQNSADPLEILVSVLLGVSKAHFDKGIQIQHIFAYDSSFILITGYRSFNFCAATFTCRDVHDIWRDHGANEPHAHGEHVPDSLLTRHARQLP